jgi:hypothetical protein
LAENAKALEITLVKELGKIAPYLRKKGCPIMVKALAAGARRGYNKESHATV